MDRRINYRIVLDTETCPIEKLEQVDAHNMLVYDIGWAVIDKRGKIYKTKSFINKDVFLKKDLMESAYYVEKLPQYYKDIKSGNRLLLSWFEIRQELIQDIQKYSIKEIYAHNAYFDYTAIQTTQKWVTKEKYKYFFPKEIIICDTLKMSRMVIAKMSTYKKFCIENNFLTSQGKPRLTAEVLYKFISKNMDFVESHTGLEDVLIEKEILRYCFKQHKRMTKELFNKKF